LTRARGCPRVAVQTAPRARFRACRTLYGQICRGHARPAGDRAAGGRIDWWGNITFAVGLGAILTAVTYGIQPYGGHDGLAVVLAVSAGLAALAALASLLRGRHGSNRIDGTSVRF
jgi:hypothetical protein